MPKSKNVSRTTEPAQDVRKLYARAYATRLAKQVADEVDSPRRKTTKPKKSDGKA